MKIRALLVFLLFVNYGQSAFCAESDLAKEIEDILLTKELAMWYPRCIDNEYGGFLSNFDYMWKPLDEQNKMIVTQARHVWTTSKAAEKYPNNPVFAQAAEHGFLFLKNVMWDSEYGGFYMIRTRDGQLVNDGYRDEKRTYGNAFGLYAVSAYYALSKDPSVLEFAQEIFKWIEDHAYDPQYGGYFQFLDREGKVFGRDFNSDSGDVGMAGTKDQNSSIHMLEAYTELYIIWPDPRVESRLRDLLYIIRDTITTPKGYLRLFLTPDWTPVSNQDSAKAYIMEHIHSDHISFGHDVETAYLMLEASHTLGIKNDTLTLKIAKKMVNHALDFGWDKEYFGLFDGGYYFKGEGKPQIVLSTKAWWSQVEALNAFLMMYLLFPEEEKYFDYFEKQWQFIKKYLIDFEHGGWYSYSIEKGDRYKKSLKGQIWKGSYHTSRSLMNCHTMLLTKKVFD